MVEPHSFSRRSRRGLPLQFLAALLVLGAGCAAGPFARGDGSARELGVLIAADRQRAASMVVADPVALERSLSPELSYTHSTGLVEDRATLVRNLLRGEVDYLSIESPRPQARLYGDVGIVTGPVDMLVGFRGREIAVQSVYTAVYRLEFGQWRLVAYQSTTRAQDEP